MPAYGPPSPRDFHTLAVYFQGERHFDQYVLLRICSSQDERRWALVDFSDGHFSPAVKQTASMISAAMKKRLQEDPQGLTWEWVRGDLRRELKREHIGMAQLSAPFADFDRSLALWKHRLLVPVIEVPRVNDRGLAS